MSASKMAKRVRSASPFRRSPTAKELIEHVRQQEIDLHRQQEQRRLSRSRATQQPAKSHSERVLSEAPSYRRHSDGADRGLVYDPMAAKNNSSFHRVHSEPAAAGRRTIHSKMASSHVYHNHDTTTSSSRARLGSQEASHRQVERHRRFLRPNVESSKMTEATAAAKDYRDPRLGRAQSLRQALSRRTAELIPNESERNGETSSANNFATPKHDKRLKETSQKKKETGKAHRDRPKGKIALKLILCANKARDLEYEQYLAGQQQFQPLEYEAVAEFNDQRIHAHVENGKQERSSTLNKNSVDQKHSSIESVTVLPSPEMKQTISEVTATNRSVFAEKVLRQQDISSIREILHQIELNLEEATRRGLKISRAEMVRSLSPVASTLDMSVEQLLTGQIVGSRLVPSSTMRCQSYIPDDDLEDGDSRDSDSGIDPSTNTSPTQYSPSGDGAGDEDNSKDVNDDGSGSEKSEFTKWVYELEDDDSRDARDFIRELFSSLSAISRSESVSQTGTEEGISVPTQSNRSGDSSFALAYRPSTMNEGAPIGRRAISFKEVDCMSPLALGPAIQSTTKNRFFSSATHSSCSYLNSYDGAIDNRLKSRRSRSWQRISQSMSSPGPNRKEPNLCLPIDPFDAFQCANDSLAYQEDAKSEESWSDTNVTDTEFDVSTFQPDADGFTSGVCSGFRNRFMNLGALCGSIDIIAIGMEHVQKKSCFHRA